MKKINLNTLRKYKTDKEKIVCITVYDASFAALLDEAEVDVFLVGDTLGMVIQGHDTTLPVEVDHIIYHTQAVRRGSQRAFLIADMPFLSEINPDVALQTAGRLMKEGGAHMVKLEGGAAKLSVVEKLSNYGVPVCGHLGLLPQSINQLGAYKVQGKDEASAKQILQDAKALQAAGAEMLVLECVPQRLAADITESLHIPVIGIGAGPHCDGQVLVLQDVLGLSTQLKPRFAKNFLIGKDSILSAAQAFVSEVKSGK
ncbi:MAG: 3-methyl-2-oxobutanoate hydroxymethyltransferase, partial [Thiohalomonadales bacterium]